MKSYSNPRRESFMYSESDALSIAPRLWEKENS